MKTSLTRKYIGFGLSAVEWYDFAIYASLASVLGELFFNFHDPLMNLLYAFTTFSIGYITRPLGSSLFGYLAVRTHNDISIQYTLLLMSISTIGISLLPVYEIFSTVSTLCLCFFRLLQGLAMGGCYGASYLYVSQNAKSGHKNRATAFVAMGFMAGFILGNTAISILHQYCTQEWIMSIGWRLPFMFGGILSFTLFLICKKTHFLQLLEHSPTCPQKVSLNNHKQNISTVLKCLLVIGLDMIGFHLFFVFNTEFLKSIKFSSSAYLSNINTLCMILLASSIWIFSYITDKWNNSHMLILSSLLFILLGFSFPWISSVDYFLGILMLGTCYGALPNWVISQFKQNKHLSYYTGLSFNIASALFGGITPIVAIILLKKGIWILKGTIIAIGLIILTTLLINQLIILGKKNIKP